MKFIDNILGIKPSSGVLETLPTSGISKKLGYSGTDIKNEYLIRITNKRPKGYLSEGQSQYIQITAPLQEKVTTKMQANWSPLSSSGFIQDSYTKISQALTGRSLVSRFNSRRIWTGTSPLTFTLSLKFEAITNTMMEVTEPVKELQRMILPYSSIGGMAESILTALGDSKNVTGEFFLAPPGPDPLNILGLDKVKSGITAYEGEEITVHIGKLMTLKNVVVKDVIVDHNPRFEKGGATISSVVTITFETFEIITKEVLDDIYSSDYVTVAPISNTTDKLSQPPTDIPQNPYINDPLNSD